MVFGKKQILMATLVVALGAAIYLHSTLSMDGKSLLQVNGDEIKAVNAEAEGVEVDTGDPIADSEKKYGETQFVNAEPEDSTTQTAVIDSDDYFVSARLKRQQGRDAVIEGYQEIINNAGSSDDEKSNAINSSSDLNYIIEIEGNIENLVMAKGFADCMAYIDNGTANIVVKTPGLLASEAAQIKDIIVSESGVSAHNITVTEVE